MSSIVPSMLTQRELDECIDVRGSPAVLLSSRGPSDIELIYDPSCWRQSFRRRSYWWERSLDKLKRAVCKQDWQEQP